jgi:hypothetical protein
VASQETKQRLSAVEQTKAELDAGQAADIGSSITLVWACMEALPRILTGAPRIAMSIRSHMLAANASDDTHTTEQETGPYCGATPSALVLPPSFKRPEDRALLAISFCKHVS